MPSTLRPYPLHTAPKPHAHYQELTDAELAAKARRIASIDGEIANHLRIIAEKRREQAQVINEIRLGTSGDIGPVEPCGLCGFTHEGAC